MSGIALLAGPLILCDLVGCVSPGAPRSSRDREIAAAADAILGMQPDANWTACYNRLLALGRPSLDYIASRPIMQRRAAPDDLRVMLHTSLLRILADPLRAPRLSVNCLETTLDVLHFDLKVRGRRLGEVVVPTPRAPDAWHDLYPIDFDQELAREIDVEGDRRAVLRWWQTQYAGSEGIVARRPLRPRAEHLWAVLSRRYADLWTHDTESSVVLCGMPPTQSTLFHGATYDYNLVRAACIWLTTSEDPDAENGLIELVGHPSRIVSYNARFALMRSPDARIRGLIERYNEGVPPATGPGPRHATDGAASRDRDTYALFPITRTCGEQWSATHEVGQVYSRLCVRDRSGKLYRRQVWRR